MKWRNVSWVVIPVVMAWALAHAEAAPTSVLFVGNSFTSYHDMPQMVAALARAAGQPSPEMDVVTAGGGSLEDHFQDKSGWPLRTLKAKKWSFVILQDHSLKLAENSSSFLAYGKKWADAAKAQGAKVILFVPWAKRTQPGDQAKMDTAYAALAKSVGGKLAPVGAIWARVRKEMPDAPLYDRDGNHPTSLGQYVTALSLYAAVYGKSPVGLPGRLVAGASGKELVDFSARPEEIGRMQRIVAELGGSGTGK